MLRWLPLFLLPMPAVAGTSLYSWDLDDPAVTDCPLCADTYQCVAGAYSELWQDRLSFPDPVPEGAVVTGVDAVLHGVFGCDAPSTADLSLDGTLIEAKALPGTCDCGDCDAHTFAVSAPDGWPTYAYGGENHLDFVTAGNFCVDLVELYLTWEAPGPSPDDDDDSVDDDDDVGDDDDSPGDDDLANDDDALGDDDAGEDDDDAAADDDASGDGDADEDDQPGVAPAATSQAPARMCSSAGAGALLWLAPLLLARRR